MCEQTPLEYKGGDIVWVKLRSCWWPGEVKDWDSVPPELAELEKKSLCAVKFFEEDSYEIVKDINNIYIYNCKRKNEFIKKGLDMYRRDNSFMKKFPGDVSAAEEKTGGSPDIIDSPIFGPKKKVNYTSIIFGTSPKSPKKSGRRSLKTPTTHTVTSASSSRRSLPIITHPRFLGNDDHQVRILIQSPEEKRDTESNNVYTCPTCGFQTSRVGVIVLHNKSHIQGVYSTLISTGKKIKRSTPKKAKKGIRMTHSKTSSFDEDLALIQQGIFPLDSTDDELYDEDDEEPKVKKRRKTPKAKKPAPKKPKHDASQVILAEWDNDSTDEEEEELNKTIGSMKEDGIKKDAQAEEKPTEKEKESNVEKSCFDFDEDEEEKVVLGKIRSPSTESKTDASKSTDFMEKASSSKENSVSKLSKNLEESTSDTNETQVDNEKAPESANEKVLGTQNRRSTRNSGKTGLKNNFIADDESKESHENEEKEPSNTEVIEDKIASTSDCNSNQKDSEKYKKLDSVPAQESSEIIPEVQESAPKTTEKPNQHRIRSRKQRHEKREDTSTESFEINAPSTSHSTASDLEQPEPLDTQPKRPQRKSKSTAKAIENKKSDRKSSSSNLKEFEALETSSPSTSHSAANDLEQPEPLEIQSTRPQRKSKLNEKPPTLIAMEVDKHDVKSHTPNFEEFELNSASTSRSAASDVEQPEPSEIQSKRPQRKSKLNEKSTMKAVETNENDGKSHIPNFEELKALEINSPSTSRSATSDLEQSEPLETQSKRPQRKSKMNDKSTLKAVEIDKHDGKSHTPSFDEFEVNSPSTSHSVANDLEQPEPSESNSKRPHRKSKLNEKSTSKTVESDKNVPKSHIPNFEEFEALMQSTTVPSLPDVPPDTLKEEQNFPVAKMKKIPDKNEPLQLHPAEVTKSSNETATKHTNPKKRFVKAFEDLEMEEKKKSEKRDSEIPETSSVQEDKGEKKCRAKGEAENEKDLESNTEKSEEKGLEVLKLKSQLMTKLSEKPEEKEQILPKYKKFDMKRTLRKSTKSELAASPTQSEKIGQRKLSTRSATEKEIEAQNKALTAVVMVDKLDLSGKASCNDSSSSNTANQDCSIRKKIEIIPKNHGEVNITLTKVLENNNAKGDVPFKKYLYSRRQGRYSVKYRSRLSYLDSPKPSAPDNIDQQGKSSGTDKSIVSPVSVPTVEEIEFPKTSIQRTVTRQSLRRTSHSEDAHKSDTLSTGDQHSDTVKIDEDQSQQKSKIDNISSPSAQEADTAADEEFISHKKDNIDHMNAEEPAVEQTNDVNQCNFRDKPIESNSKIIAEELGSDSTLQSKPKSQSSHLRRYTRRSKRVEDSQANEEMNIENVDNLEITEAALQQKESDENKLNDDLNAQDSLEEYVDIMTVTPKKKKMFGKSASIMDSLKSDIILTDRSENVLDSKQLTFEKSVIIDNKDSTTSVDLNDTEEIRRKGISLVLESLNGSYAADTSDILNNETVISEKQVLTEQLPSQELENKNGAQKENLIEANKHTESRTAKIDEHELQKHDQVVDKCQQEVSKSPELLTDKKEDEPQPVIEFPTEVELTNKSDEIIICEEVSKSASEEIAKETTVENQVETKKEIKNLQSTDKNDSALLTDLNNSEQRPVEETDKVIANVFVTTSENEKEELSALSTLAAVSELSPPLEEQTTSLEKIKAIEANLTVVSQTDLENVQVEIVNAPESKSVTLTNFSVDFTDGKQTDIIEKPKSKHCMMESSNTEIPPDELPYVTKKSTVSIDQADNNDLEDQMSSLLPSNKENSVHSETITESDQAMTSSKLLEILTDNSKSNTKSIDVPSNEDIALPVSKTHISPSKDNKLIQEIELSESQISIIEAKPVHEIKSAKNVLKSAIPERKPLVTKTSIPTTIFTEKIMKPFGASETVSVQKVTSKRTNKDIEDIDTYIIQKPTKKLALDPDLPIKSPFSTATPVIKKTVSTPKGRGKAKILQQTIITPSGDVIQPTVAQAQQQSEDCIFDINSMPIVLGDQILTPESIESMPVVISEAAVSITSKTPAEKINVVKKSTPQLKSINKIPTLTTTPQPTIIRTYASAQKLAKGQKNYQVSSSKIVKSSPALINQPSKPGKFIIVSPNAANSSKTIIGKKPVTKQSVILPATSETLEPVGNKIMIVTNQQGQQQRVLLTPAQQKMLGYQPPSTKLTKAALKSGIMTKGSKNAPAIVSQSSGNVIAQPVITTKAQTVAGGGSQSYISSGQVFIPITQAKQRIAKSDVSKTGAKKIQTPATKGRLQEAQKNTGASKTIVIKNQQGQIVKKIQGTDDALLEQQVQEQVQAIKASSSFTALKPQSKIETVSKISKSPTKRSYPKKAGTSEILQKPLSTTITTTIHPDIPPPLTALSPSSPSVRIDTGKVTHVEEAKMEQTTEDKPKEQTHLNELIIQDALGNQMTITEGQILAFPSETVDGQTQSYMLVSLDKSGNLTPLNNEALLSLDPNLAIGGGDLSNIVLQVDDRGVVVAPAPVTIPEEKEKPKTESQKPSVVEEPIEKPPVPPLSHLEPPPATVTDSSTTLALPLTAAETPALPIATDENQTVTCSVDTGNNQQLIISGDPISTQKFIESLTEGNADLANLLASAEGNILIHTDGQQILINTESESQLLLPVNAGNVAIESTEGGGNPIFATQSNKNQDILAAALADTDVFQQEQPTVQSKMPQSQLSPNSTLFPMNVSNVLETSLTLSSPIMTPLEVPSSNSKKIPDEESDILTKEVPKNVDLPITITDPNISQTVAQQQVATLMATELQNNLDLPLTIADQGISASSTEMNSPSYVYSLPSLDDSVEMNQKAFGNPISMPLLNEEAELSAPEKANDSEKSTTIESQSEEVMDEKPKEIVEEDNDSAENNDDKRSHSPVSSSFMSSIDGGLCTLGGAMCSSLSEPPPDMFDLSSNYLTVDDTKKDDVHIPESNSNSNDSQPTFSNDHHGLEDGDRFRSNGPKRDNFLNENSVLRNRSPISNIDENSTEIPLQPLIVAHISDKETQEVECSSLECERSEGSSDSMVMHHDGGTPSSTESSSDTALLNSESSILDSSKRKSDDELDLSTQKKPRVDD